MWFTLLLVWVVSLCAVSDSTRLEDIQLGSGNRGVTFGKELLVRLTVCSLS